MSSSGVRAINNTAWEIGQRHPRGTWNSKDAMDLIAAGFQGDTRIQPEDEGEVLDKFRNATFGEFGAEQLFDVILGAEERYEEPVSPKALDQVLRNLHWNNPIDNAAITLLNKGPFDDVLNATEKRTLCNWVRNRPANAPCSTGNGSEL